jgi:4-hydroxy-3-methylbut-2-enyl diphosphate reductase
MQIICGKNSGFCFGVQNSVNKTKEALKNYNKVYCLGELIHNNEFLQTLYNDGLKLIDNINEAESGSTVVIRAHGVVPETYNRNDINIIDATCPRVKKIHELVNKYSNEGYTILITGDSNHPETIGISGYCNGKYYIVDNEESIPEIEGRVCLVSQTTFSYNKFNDISKMIVEKYEDALVLNTICEVTQNRQREVKEIACSVDAIIIVGSKNSSNTMKLYDIAKNECKNVIQVFSEKELPDLSMYERVGIMAGASVPQSTVDEIIKQLK